jgi:hypothetical protein
MCILSAQPFTSIHCGMAMLIQICKMYVMDKACLFLHAFQTFISDNEKLSAIVADIAGMTYL